VVWCVRACVYVAVCCSAAQCSVRHPYHVVCSAALPVVCCRLHTQGEKVWDLLGQGAVVYVCGGATGFGQALARAFRTIAARHGAMSPMAADRYFNELLSSGRYLEDLSD